MRVEQSLWTAADGWVRGGGADGVHDPQLVLYFAAPGILESSGIEGLIQTVDQLTAKTAAEQLH